MLDILLAQLCLLISGAFCKSLSVSISADLRPSPDALLAIETVSFFNSTAFFPLLSLYLNDEDEILSSKNDLYNVLNVSVKRGFLNNASAEIVKQNFALGTRLPFLEWMYSVSDEVSNFECENVVWIDGSYSCYEDVDVRTISQTNSTVIPKLYSEDKVIGDGKTWVVVYAEFRSEKFKSIHFELLELALTHQITYVLRFRSFDEQKKTEIGGYSAHLNLKNTDYFTVNTDDETTLSVNKSPVLVSEESSPYLGFSANALILQAENKFKKLLDVTNNFVDYIPELSQMDGAHFKEAMLKQNVFKSSGINAFVINGKPHSPVNVFELQKIIEEEEKLLDGLRDILPKRTDPMKILNSGIGVDVTKAGKSDSEVYKRYNLTAVSRAIGWINDIRNDETLYTEYSRDLSTIKRSKGPFFPVKNNVHTLVIAGDISHPHTIQVVNETMNLGLPIQVGIVSENPTWLRISKLGLHARMAFNLYLSYYRSSMFPDASDAQMAIDMSEQTLNNMIEEKYLNVSKLPKLSNTKKWLKNFDLIDSEEPAIFVNGVYVAYDDWKTQLPIICTADSKYLKSLDTAKLSKTKNVREVLFNLGKSQRVDLLDPLEPYSISKWPLSVGVTSFPNLNERHSVLFETSLSTPQSLDILETLIDRAIEMQDLELNVMPLKGIDEYVYKGLSDSSMDSLNTLSALITAYKNNMQTSIKYQEPIIPITALESKPDTLYVDGLKIVLKKNINVNYLNRLISEQAERVSVIQDLVPGISGSATAFVAEAAQNRVPLGIDNRAVDINIKGLKLNSEVVFIINPATQTGQLLASYAKVAVKAKLNVKIVVSAGDLDPKLSNVPGNYRTVTNSSSPAIFDLTDKEDNLYSLKVDAPDSWLLVPSASTHNLDFDNILVNQLESNVNEIAANYNLRSILVEGNIINSEVAIDVELYSKNGTLVDSSVVINEGYFQLHASSPGSYFICSPNGTLLSTNIQDDGCFEINLTNFTPEKLQVFYLAKQPAEMLPGNVKKQTQQRSHADINVFTIASGHMYERLAEIMMLSVLNHTDKTVKFWLIENFMSERFQKFIPVMASKYGFEYELVKYQWPSWLRPQTDKQRMIWGYKVLFLDTLFPKDLNDIIFIDSDQVIRTDLQDLLDIDLGDAPYAFAPMCQDNEELSDYMFWNQGYWKKRFDKYGFKYHISALYRVNLQKFRALNAGNTIRQYYQLMSTDSQSLANLDQDLVNDLQTHIPIYTLDQDWLWCETWCSNERLSQARTIDLCNNPLTKEPKLEKAKRSIPEWTQYDDEIKKLEVSGFNPEDVSKSSGDNTSEYPVDKKNMRDSETLQESPNVEETNTSQGSEKPQETAATFVESEKSQHSEDGAINTEPSDEHHENRNKISDRKDENEVVHGEL